MGCSNSKLPSLPPNPEQMNEPTEFNDSKVSHATDLEADGHAQSEEKLVESDEHIDDKLAVLRNAVPGISDENLLKFLRFKNDAERAIECINAYRAFRSENSWIDNPPLRAGSDTRLRNILESEFVCCPEGMFDKLGRPCLFVRFRHNDMQDGRTPQDVVRAAFYTIERFLNRPAVIENGIVGVYDFAGTSKRNFHLGIPKLVFPALSGKKIPIHLKAFYFINPPWFFKAFFRVASAFLSQKLRDRVNFLQSFEELSEFIDPEKLLEEYGGTVKHDQKRWVADQIEKEDSNDLHLLEELVRGR